jgi:hypothetical protein
LAVAVASIRNSRKHLAGMHVNSHATSRCCNFPGDASLQAMHCLHCHSSHAPAHCATSFPTCLVRAAAPAAAAAASVNDASLLASQSSCSIAMRLVGMPQGTFAECVATGTKGFLSMACYSWGLAAAVTGLLCRGATVRRVLQYWCFCGCTAVLGACG